MKRNLFWRMFIGVAIWTLPVLYDLAFWTDTNSPARESITQIAVFTLFGTMAVALRFFWGSTRFLKRDVAFAANYMLTFFNVSLAARWLMGGNSGLCWWSIASSWGVWIAFAVVAPRHRSAVTASLE